MVAFKGPARDQLNVNNRRRILLGKGQGPMGGAEDHATDRCRGNGRLTTQTWRRSGRVRRFAAVPSASPRRVSRFADVSCESHHLLRSVDGLTTNSARNSCNPVKSGNETRSRQLFRCQLSVTSRRTSKLELVYSRLSPRCLCKSFSYTLNW